MATQEFDNGKIIVFSRGRSFGGRKPEVNISWYSIGTVSIARAQEFANAMTEAITYAKSEEERLGIRGAN